MKNNLGILRKEFNLTQKDLAEILQTSTTNLGYYEQGKRDFSTKLLFKLKEIFNCSIDFILGYSETGIELYFEGEEIIKYIISLDELNELKNKNVIYYKDDSYKRYININLLLGINNIDLTSLMKEIPTLEELKKLFPILPLTSKDDFDKLYIIHKAKSLTKEKANIVRKLLEYL